MKACIRLGGAVILLGALSSIGANPALAQQSTTATYGDWVVRCVIHAGTPPQKNCDMDQTTEVSGKNVPLSRVVIARPVRGKPVTLLIQLPVNVWVSSGVKLFLDEKDPGRSGQFTHCVPAGCFASIDLPDAALKAFRVEAKPGKIGFKNAAGRDVAIPISFKGFALAFDALSKE